MIFGWLALGKPWIASSLTLLAMTRLFRPRIIRLLVRRTGLLRRLLRRLILLLGALLDRLFKARQIVSGVDQRHVRKGLREIADLALEMRVVFLAEQAQIIAQRDQAAEQPLGVGHPTLQHID